MKNKTCKKRKEHTLFVHSWCSISRFQQLDHAVAESGQLSGSRGNHIPTLSNLAINRHAKKPGTWSLSAGRCSVELLDIHTLFTRCMRANVPFSPTTLPRHIDLLVSVRLPPLRAALNQNTALLYRTVLTTFSTYGHRSQKTEHRPASMSFASSTPRTTYASSHIVSGSEIERWRGSTFRT